MNMCTVKLRNDLIRAQITPQKEKATNTTAGCDWSSLSLGSIKKISALNKTESEIWRQYMTIVKFEPKSFHYILSQADPWFWRKGLLILRLAKQTRVDSQVLQTDEVVKQSLRWKCYICYIAGVFFVCLSSWMIISPSWENSIDFMIKDCRVRRSDQSLFKNELSVQFK